MTPLLSICIPTYNRAPFLKNCLRQLSEQLQTNPLALEILVSDNGSPDETESMVRESIKDFTHTPFRYSRNATNEGVEKNLLKLSQMAQGKYIWFMGDDDGFLPGALSSVMRYIEEGNDLIICNWINTPHEALSPRENFDFGDSADRYFHTPNDFMSQLLFHISFMSSLIFPREWFINYSAFGLQTKFPHLYVVYRGMLQPDSRAVLTHTPLVLHWMGNESDFGNREWLNIITEDPAKIARQLLHDGYSKNAIRLFCRHVVIGWVVILFSQSSALNKLRMFPLKKITTCFGVSIPLYLKIIAFLFFPNRFLQILQRIKKKLVLAR